MKCALYIRVSKNVEEQKQSLKNQRDLLTELVKNKEWDIFDFYVDVKTATKEGRKDFNRLIEDVKCRKFDIIISKELSRLARNELIAMELKRLTENNSVKIYTLDGASNLEDNTDMFGFYSWHYAKESRNIKS